LFPASVTIINRAPLNTMSETTLMMEALTYKLLDSFFMSTSTMQSGPESERSCNLNERENAIARAFDLGTKLQRSIPPW
jgi:hypothetical protein